MGEQPPWRGMSILSSEVRRRGLGLPRIRGSHAFYAVVTSCLWPRNPHLLRTQGCPAEPACHAGRRPDFHLRGRRRHPRSGLVWARTGHRTASRLGSGGRRGGPARDWRGRTHRGDGHGTVGDPWGYRVGHPLRCRQLVRPGRAERRHCWEEPELESEGFPEGQGSGAQKPLDLGQPAFLRHPWTWSQRPEEPPQRAPGPGETHSSRGQPQVPAAAHPAPSRPPSPEGAGRASGSGVWGPVQPIGP